MNKSLKKTFTTNQVLERYEQLRSQYNLLPVKVSAFYKNKIEEEIRILGHDNGPLNRAVYPTEEKISLKLDYEVNDFIEDKSHMPEVASKSFLHKYPDRILFMPQTICLSNCMYCFRQDMLEDLNEQELEKSLDHSLGELVEYIKLHPEISEVILSGGEPMMLSAKKLEDVFSTLQQKTKVKQFRIHTRSIVFDPRSFTKEHMACLKKYNVRIVFHIIHPYEICDSVKLKIKEIESSGLRLFNQFPLMRKINDHPMVLLKLFEQLDELNIRNLSVFFPEPVHYSGAFRIHFARIIKIVDEFNQMTPSWLNSTRFCQDTQLGKVRLENMVEYNKKVGKIYFERKNKRIEVPDHPEELDEQSALDVLLWKDRC